MQENNYEIVKRLSDLMARVVRALPDEQSTTVYDQLLKQIKPRHTEAVQVQLNAARAFVEKNLDAILSENRLLLRDPVLRWTPLKQNKSVDVDLMKAMVNADDETTMMIHYHLLRIAECALPDNEAVRQRLQSMVVPSGGGGGCGDTEQMVVEKIFSHFDPTRCDLSKSGGFENIVALVMSDLQSSGAQLDYKELFKQILLKMKEISQKIGGTDDDGMMQDFIETAERNDYNLIAVLPKLFGMIEMLRKSKRIPENSAAALMNMATFKPGASVSDFLDTARELNKHFDGESLENGETDQHGSDDGDDE